MDRRLAVSDEERLAVHDMVDELKRRVLSGGVQWETAKWNLQALIAQLTANDPAGADIATGSEGKENRSRAEKARKWFERWYRSLGLTATIPAPTISNRELTRREKQGQMLVFRPASHEGIPSHLVQAVTFFRDSSADFRTIPVRKI